MQSRKEKPVCVCISAAAPRRGGGRCKERGDFSFPDGAARSSESRREIFPQPCRSQRPPGMVGKANLGARGGIPRKLMVTKLRKSAGENATCRKVGVES